MWLLPYLQSHRLGRFICLGYRYRAESGLDEDPEYRRLTSSPAKAQAPFNTTATPSTSKKSTSILRLHFINPQDANLSRSGCKRHWNVGFRLCIILVPPLHGIRISTSILHFNAAEASGLQHALKPLVRDGATLKSSWNSIPGVALQGPPISHRIVYHVCMCSRLKKAMVLCVE